MTLKELFAQVSFEELLPYLMEFESERLDRMFAFREAYDRLFAMQPNLDYQGTVDIKWREDGDDEERWIDVCYLSDDEWEDNLAKELVVADDVHLSLAELAMYCLWDITYYGRSPKIIDKNIREIVDGKNPSNPYEIALDKLDESIWRHQTPRRLRHKKDGKCYTIYNEDFFWKKIIGKNKMNRSKRKRKYRQDKRRKFLKTAGRRQSVIEELTVPGSSIPADSLAYLHGVKEDVRYDFYGVDKERPLSYILELMTRYHEVDRTKFDNAVVVVRYPASTPIASEELEGFNAAVRRHWGYADMLFGTLPDETADEVMVVLLLNKR